MISDSPYQVIEGDCLAVMHTLTEASVDAIVTDPPYGLGFMGKEWDHGVPGMDFWAAALCVAKPGAHLLAFGGTRTFHRLTCAIEDAGWEVRDCLSWLYGSGFPKSHNGPWGGTALKPAWEPVIMARKPLVGTVAANHAAHGTGALNIDGCRIGTDAGWSYPNGRGGEGWHGRESLSTDLTVPKKADAGRWPANVALDAEAAAMLDEQSGISTSTGGQASLGAFRNGDVYGRGRDEREARNPGLGDSGGASRFFFVSKECPLCGSAKSAAESSDPSSGPAGSVPSGAPTEAESGLFGRGPASTDDSASSTQSPARVSSADSPGLTGTTPTTPTCCESCGSVLRVTAVRTSLVGAGRAGDANGPASGTRFLYSAKASRGEREAGLREAGLREAGRGDGREKPIDNAYLRMSPVRNTHPTVKPVALMRWLIRLVTPAGGLVLDPFAGSGTTGVAATAEGCRSILIEREGAYAEIARARNSHAAKQGALGLGEPS